MLVTFVKDANRDSHIQKAVDRYFSSTDNLIMQDVARLSMAHVYKKAGFQDARTSFLNFLSRRERKTTASFDKEEVTKVMSDLSPIKKRK